MAPEIHMSQAYSGAVVDLFAAAIILFIMITQHPPFSRAHPTDPFYKLLCSNRGDLFWKAHSKNKPKGAKFFSDEFKDLITTMLQFDPKLRPTLAEIASHPWLNGETASIEEVQKEFSDRKSVLDEQAQNNEEEVPDVPDVFTQGAAHRGEGDADDDSVLPLIRTSKNYVGGCKKYTEFFSTATEDKLFDTLAYFAENQATEFKLDDKSYKCKMGVLQNDEKIELVVKVLKIGEDKHCVEFTKKSGNKHEFNKFYQEAKTFFGGLVNTTNDE